ncbi:hypothetical protein M8J76_007742 [Diaphorina citri]|nr:hypothetical protein M8J76_007742 [Diaphorina citri]
MKGKKKKKKKENEEEEKKAKKKKEEEKKKKNDDDDDDDDDDQGFWAMLMSCVIYLAIDAFYFSIIYICCGQLQLIYISMENMFPPEGDGSDGTKGRDGSDGRGRDRRVRLINEIDNARLYKIARLHAHVLR